jgi:hypothetical protein
MSFVQLQSDLSADLTRLVETLAKKYSVDLEVLFKSFQLPEDKKVVNRCKYILQKVRAGQPCGELTCSESETHCKKHLRYAGESKTKVPLGAKDLLAPGKPTSQPLTTPAHRIVLSKNEFGNHEHKTTGMVFNSDKKVFGKQVGNQVLSLKEEDILICKQHNFQYTDEAVALPDTVDPEEHEVLVDDLENV